MSGASDEGSRSASGLQYRCGLFGDGNSGAPIARDKLELAGVDRRGDLNRSWPHRHKASERLAVQPNGEIDGGQVRHPPPGRTAALVWSSGVGSDVQRSRSRVVPRLRYSERGELDAFNRGGVVLVEMWRPES